ncbi:hypothetical protein VB774_04325 [Pseudanabaena galeata UHCC 0370]|uniref:Uncharacterized protein n=1 Tax=Pseudanabaena galeata UHCC 0370 TaxID=3110310 RepID=A0ABU5TF14_9CYAN|nr:MULTISPECIES: hypothetical protein [Pseudanabaena]MEA5476840.1 hypothetical protein [Pseudanabaena galeata UHCC 0370]MEA5488787.1 hypothetical protein [Pseudanabaena sp. CCNP1317]WGS71257.1 hypothetical protein OA858_16245 [Pseudanabaena galeata CCNP1313]
MILNSLNETRSIEVITLAGRERGIVFLGKTFVADKSYKSLDEAIAACRQDLDLGLAVLITPDAEKFRVWVSVPNQMIFQAA